MCGIAGIFGSNWNQSQLNAMVASQRHRGPDGDGKYIDPESHAGLGHNRLKIIDLSEAGRQPMSDPTGRYHISFNGEIYNYLELRQELNYSFSTRTDTEVLLAAFEKWGERCLDHLIGMFAFAIWDQRSKKLFAARDRFGVKPVYFHYGVDGTLMLASEIKALHAAGVPQEPDETSWATYLALGLSDHSERSFWKGIHALPPGHSLSWQDGRLSVSCWYDLAARTGDRFDDRSITDVQEEYVALLEESVKLRFRSDVPVGINLSGGLDSSTLLGLVHAAQGKDSDVKAFTFTTGDPQYDELPWVRQMLSRTHHELVECRLEAHEVPALAESVQISQDEPFGGLPTLAYARLFETARSEGVIVLLDGNGMDEQWAGYDYYRNANGNDTSVVQGTRESPTRAECLTPEFRAQASQFSSSNCFHDSLRNLQYRDARYTKIPRAMRFNDRVSMRASTELREPFLDHRLFELALRQPAERKIANGTGKWLLRQITKNLLPDGVVEAPKRPLQTPQREWLRGPLREWATGQIEEALAAYGNSWLDRHSVRAEWKNYCSGEADNSFYIWQWIGVGLLANRGAFAGA
ncbi:MAG: asparagine synthase (glutamine-hydrolyzing) [Pyrinomonadaceae bacterium]|nr:asparagine synthase (glutamine-hydrolyzing) [Pyrinomonadaceae bacterium]